MSFLSPTSVIGLSIAVCWLGGQYLIRRRARIDAVRTVSYSDDVEDQQRSAAAVPPRLPLYYRRNRTRVSLALGVALFLVLSFVHEWVQESLQIRAEVSDLYSRGPPSSCYDVPAGFVNWLMSSSPSSRAHDCREYVDAVHRLPVANPLSALVRMLTSLILDPWARACEIGGSVLRSFLHEQSATTQLMVFVSIVIVASVGVNVCIAGVCNPDGIVARFIQQRTTTTSVSVRRRPVYCDVLTDDDERRCSEQAMTVRRISDDEEEDEEVSCESHSIGIVH